MDSGSICEFGFFERKQEIKQYIYHYILYCNSYSSCLVSITSTHHNLILNSPSHVLSLGTFFYRGKTMTNLYRNFFTNIKLKIKLLTIYLKIEIENF